VVAAGLCRNGAFGRLTKSVPEHSRRGRAPFRDPAVPGGV